MIGVSAAAIFAALFILVLLAWPGKRISKRRLGIERKPLNPGQSVDALLERWGKRTGVQAALSLAGSDLDAGVFVLRVLVVAVLSSIAGLLVSPLIGLAAFVLAFVGAKAWVGYRGTKRRDRFAQQLPDFLQSLVVSLRSGFGLAQTVEAVMKDSQEPMKSEVGRALAEVRMGRDMSEALRSLAQRMDNPDLEWVVGAIDINRETGGNLSEILSTVNDTLLGRQRIRRKVRTLTAEGRLSARFLTILPFVMAFWQWKVHPDGFSELTHGPGLIVLATCGVLVLVGWLWIRRIVSIKL